MNVEHTLQQTTDEQSRALALSLKPSRPPTQVPGYEPRMFLGAGAYGEVWVAVDRTTGRQVAIKFYAHQGGLDWSILSREVEKLAFLSADRYVVQLLDVGWDATPPYYVMEYIEQGSLEDLLKNKHTLKPREAVSLFRDVAVGLLHAHGKGVLHCDLKPANVLLDQDDRPRLADFGQSRLSHEQTPALGTLFYMAPEQADLNAVPDVRWDVYALGALLYCMLTGSPPHRTDTALTEFETAADLEERLARYRHIIQTSPPPSAHRQVKGVDRELADIVDRCLAVNREQRFANVQEVLDALSAREQRRARWPTMLLGFVGPALLLGIMSIFAYTSFGTMMNVSDKELRARALDNNRYAAKFVAKTVTNRLEHFYRAVEEMASSPRFQKLLQDSLDNPQLTALRSQLSEPDLDAPTREELRAKLVSDPARQPLQQRLQDLLQEGDPDVASWFVTDPDGLQLARAPEHDTVGRNFSWRTYFHGGSEDEPETWRATPNEHITQTNLSAVFYSRVNNCWTVTISTPVQTEADEDEPARFLGVIGVSVDVHRFVELVSDEERQFAVLVDWRPGPNKGLILQHPLFESLDDDEEASAERFESYRLTGLPETASERANYVDPLSADPKGRDYDKRWLADWASVAIREGNTGWTVIVQESYDDSIGRTLDRFKRTLATGGLIAGAFVALLCVGLWAFAIRVWNEPARGATPLSKS